jgi:hypothetical protein
MALTHDMHGMFGWKEHATMVERAYRALPEPEREHASLLAGSYSQASAINFFRGEAEPKAVSGHMTYFLWGPEKDRDGVLIAYGLPRQFLERHYRTCTEVARIVVPLARPWDTDLPVYLCRKPFGRMTDLWPELRRFGQLPLKQMDEAPAPGTVRRTEND